MSSRAFGKERPRRTRTGLRRRIPGPGFLLILLLTTGCVRETLFRSNFDANPTEQPPSQAQPVGTVAVDGPPGSVRVITSPDPPSGRWVEIRRPDGPQVAALQGNLSQFRGDGTYVFSTALFIPAGSGVATIQFEKLGQPVTEPLGFLHLDFLPDNRVRIDDDDTTAFGTFPRNQTFLVQVTLNINAASTARIVLSGAGAEGTVDHSVRPDLRALARQFGAVRIWQGFPHTGAFDVTNIVVTRRTS